MNSCSAGCKPLCRHKHKVAKRQLLVMWHSITLCNESHCGFKDWPCYLVAIYAVPNQDFTVQSHNSKTAGLQQMSQLPCLHTVCCYVSGMGKFHATYLACQEGHIYTACL